MDDLYGRGEMEVVDDYGGGEIRMEDDGYGGGDLEQIYLNADIVGNHHLINFSWAFQGHIGHLWKMLSFLEKFFKRIALKKYVSDVEYEK